jgi:hypothetical protein
MKKTITVVALLVLSALSLLVPVQASAGSSTDAALALGAFAVFNQIFGGYGVPHVVRETVVVQQPAVVYAPPPPPPPAVIYAPPPVVYYAPPPPVVVYPSGYAYWAPGYYYRPYRKYHHEHDDD